MDKIILENIEIYAFHGHLPEEQKIGSLFLIDLEISADLTIVAKTGKLEDTFDYRKAYQIVHEEMAIPSDLLEHVGGRIVDRLLKASSQINKVKLKVSKMNPPFGGSVKAVSVVLKGKRE